MGKLKDKIVFIGEGPTEFFYLDSLRDNFTGININPNYPKHTSLLELSKKIEEEIERGYRYVFCIIDMDNKDKKLESNKYAKLRKKYAKPIIKKKKDIYCEVKFFETHRCTELFFLYYFCYTSKEYLSQEVLIKDINKFCRYEKTIKFFSSCKKGLHSYFIKNGGNFENAIKNAKKSMEEKYINNRNYTYTELGLMLELLNEIENKK